MPGAAPFDASKQQGPLVGGPCWSTCVVIRYRPSRCQMVVVGPAWFMV
jgi:hypothetical protein